MPAQPDWAEQARGVRLTVGGAPKLTQRFKDGDFAVLLGGTLAALPLADVGPLSRGTVRLDAPVGLFGLDVLRPQGFLASAANREALAMALDRAALIQPFNLAGWVPTTRIVPPGLEGDDRGTGERWPGLDQPARSAVAAARVARWKAANGGRLALTVRLPAGPGADLLFDGLVSQFAGIGVDLARASPDGPADLALRDRVARYAAARWFLNQFHCGVGTALCSPDADLLVQLALAARDPAQQAAYLVDAENALAAINGFIPLGAPIRWSLVRSGVVGFADNAWASHPLFPLSRAPM